MINSSRAVDEYVSKLPENIQQLVEKLRRIILTSSDKIQEQIKHKIPFYSYKGQLCYINPSDEKVVLGFSRGADLPDEFRMLVGTGKSVRHVVFDTSKKIDEDKVRNLIYEALIVNEIKSERFYNKK
jgi:hypothetical protein